MPDYITRVTPKPDHLASGGSVAAEVDYVCTSAGITITRKLPEARGFSVTCSPASTPATPGAGTQTAKFTLTITRTTASAGTTCWVTFTMSGSPGAADKTVGYEVDKKP